jgi:S-adenosylmethionine hydrolase
MKRAVELTDERFFLPEVSSTFHGRDIFGPVAASLASGASLERLGRELGRIEALDIPWTSTADGIIEGEVIYVDSFGNLITNITKEEISSFAGTPEVLIGGAVLDGVKKTYEAAEKGGLLALIGSSGHLEVAVNTGSAEGALKTGVGEKVKVRPKR